MRLHFDFSEYEHEEDGTSVMLTVNIPDGSPHSRVTEIYDKALSMLYGYNIGASTQSAFNFSFEDDEFDDGENFKACENCVQGTCVFGCGKEFK
jgi:hypothetical protein